MIGYLSFYDIETLVATIVSQNLSQVTRNTEVAGELTKVFAELMMSMLRGQEETMNSDLKVITEMINTLATQDPNPQ